MLKMIKQAVVFGVVDGFQEPWDLSMGMTYPNDLCNRVYDRSANIGQRLGRIKAALLDPL